MFVSDGTMDGDLLSHLKRHIRKSSVVNDKVRTYLFLGVWFDQLCFGDNFGRIDVTTDRINEFEALGEPAAAQELALAVLLLSLGVDHHIGDLYLHVVDPFGHCGDVNGEEQ